MPLTLRIDPWTPAYESAIQIEEDLVPDTAPVDPLIETSDWSAPLAPEYTPPPDSIAFVDGVQRVETRVIGQDEGRLVYGAFVSVAVGAVLTRDHHAAVSASPTRRNLALSDGADHETWDIPCGNITLRFHPLSSGKPGLNGVHEALLNARRDAETQLGQQLLDAGHPLVIVDGRLNLQPTRRSLTLGLIKTLHTIYLERPHLDLLAALRPRTRTPLFRIQRDRPVYSWYVRLSPQRPIEHAWAGIVRIETLDSIGLESAARLADTTAIHLPTYASNSAWDPRAPQNIYPVSALEERLRHDMGDREWIRRHIEAHFHRIGAAA